MEKGLLPWEEIGWEDFQQLTIHYAQSSYKGYLFEEYLKQGNKQHGIDLISTTLDDNGKYITIQCKHKVTVKKSDINRIISDFKGGKFYDCSSRFILATTADLENKEVQDILFEYKQSLKESHIDFEVWDTHLLSEQLKRHKSLVEYYFGKDLAKTHCHNTPNKSQWGKNECQEDYIDRSVSTYEPNNTANSYIEQLYYRHDSINLLSQFEKSRLSAKHVCLVGDAHIGKSIYLKQLAYDLEQIDTPYKCFLIELKQVEHKPIEQILDNQYSGWSNLPSRDVVIILDGLDEVESTLFRSFLKSISSFQKGNKLVNIIFSCRKLFYKHYEVNELTISFKLYELLPMYYTEGGEYIKRQLGSAKTQFEKKISNANLDNLLLHPFYLTYLVKKYKNKPTSLPSTKIEIIRLFVEESINMSLSRETSGGLILSHEQVKFREIVQQLAFVLQLTGLNAIDDVDLQTLFTREQIALLQHSSLLGIYNNKWSFNNAIFQEHLAAFALINMSSESIIEIVSIGSKLKKLKTKWIQTVASLLSFINKESYQYQELIKFLQSDNIELVFTTEESKFDDAEKIYFVKELLARCKKYSMRPMIIDERSIASFIDSSDACKNLLIKELKSSKTISRIKVVCINVLEYVKLTLDQKNTLFNIYKFSLTKESDTYYIKEVLHTLAEQEIGDIDFMDTLTEHNELNKSHDYRDNVYRLISVLGLTEQYYWYALEGIPYLILKNRSISNTGSEFRIQEILFNTTCASKINQLIDAMCDKSWLEYYKNTYRKDHFIKRLAEISAIAYKDDPLILLQIINFILSLGRNYLREEYKGINNFFKLTNTLPLSFRILRAKLDVNKHWEYGDLITIGSIHYFLYELECGILNKEDITTIFFSIPIKDQDLQNQFRALYKDAMGEDLISSQPVLSVYDNNQKVILENDIKYIKAKSAFKKGLVDYFKAYGKRSIPDDEIYVYDDDTSRIRKDSFFISIFLRRWVKHRSRKVYLKSALERLNQANVFEYFIINEGVNCPHDKDEKYQLVIEPILEQLFHKYLSKCTFENCIWDIKSAGKEYTIRYKVLEDMIGRVFLRYQFVVENTTLMDFVWLDNGGVRVLRDENPPYDNRERKTISEIILSTLSDGDKVVFGDYIIENIKKGVKSSEVLGTHISVCSYLKLSSSLPLILKTILNSKTRDYNRYRYVNIYLELGGDFVNLLPLLKGKVDYNSHTYRALIDKLYKAKNKSIEKAMLLCLKSDTAEVEVKTVSARYLCFLGKNEGFDYLLDLLSNNDKAPYTIQGNVPISNIDTTYALNRLMGYAEHLLTTKEDGIKFYESTKELILEWLFSFGKKSENDTVLVYEFFFENQKRFCKSHPNHYNLFWYAFRTIEHYREQNINSMTIGEAKKVLQQL